MGDKLKEEIRLLGLYRQIADFVDHHQAGTEVSFCVWWRIPLVF